MFRSLIARSFLLSTLFVYVFPVYAQEPPLETTAEDGVPVEERGLTCFNYVIENAVTAAIETNIEGTAPGATLGFSGRVFNETALTIHQATLSAKVFRRDNSTFAKGDGDVMVDHFVIADNVTLLASSSIEASFEWVVPNDIASGDYYIAYAFTTPEGYDLMGFRFTDELVGNRTYFTVATETSAPVSYLSLTKTTLNGDDYMFAEPAPRVATDESVVIKTTITNPRSTTRIVPLQWVQYASGALSEDSIRGTESSLVTLAPGETKEVSYEVRTQDEAQVFVTATIKDGESKHILHVSYLRDGVTGSDAKMSGLSQFPLQAGVEHAFFTCAQTIHPVGTSTESIVTFTLADKEGNVIHSYTHNGSISESLQTIAGTFTPDKNYNYAVLTVAIEQQNVPLQKIVMTYDCTTMGPDACLPEEAAEPVASQKSFMERISTMLIGGAGVLLLIALVAYYIRRKRNGDSNLSPTAFLFALVLGASLFSVAAPVDAAELQVAWPYAGYGKSYTATAAVSDTCASGWTNTNILDDNANANHHLGEEDTDDGLSRLCLRADNPAITITSQWVSGFGVCPAGMTDTGVRDDAGSIFDSSDIPAAHSLNEEDYRPDGSNAQRWCLGATGGGATGIATRWVMWSSSTKSPPCAADEVRLLQGKSYKRNLNSEDANGGNQESLCAKIIASDPPTVPTIAGPNAVDTGVDNTYDFNSTDPAGDDIRYGITNDACTSVVSWLPSGGYTTSGNTLSRVYRRNSAGTYRISVLAEDEFGVRSACATMDVVATTPVGPAPTASISVTPTTGVLGQSLTVNWSSANVTSCTVQGPNFAQTNVTPNAADNRAVSAIASGDFQILCENSAGTQVIATANFRLNATVTLLASVDGGAFTSVDQIINPGQQVRLRWDSTDASTCVATQGAGFSTGDLPQGTADITEPAPGMSGVYGVSCEGGGDPTDTITISTRNRANFAEHGWGTTQVSSGFDPVAMTFDSITVWFQTRNNGDIATGINSPYRVRIDRGATGSFDATSAVTGTIASLDPDEYSGFRSATFYDVPFGSDYIVQASFDYPDTVIESNESDNNLAMNGSVTSPDPGISFTADRYQVRNEETTVLRWTLASPYDGLSCQVYGPNLNLTGIAIPSGNASTQEITAKSEFTLKCVAATGGTWSESLIVESQGVIEEI